MTVSIRPYTQADTRSIMDLFYDTVHAINIRHYSQEQVNTWAPRDRSYQLWEQSLGAHHTYVAVVDSTIVGFADFEDDGHLDRFYCHKDYQGAGVGTRLLAAVEDAARARDIRRFFTEASITARPFFEKRGYVVVKEQQVVVRGVTFTNYAMEKSL